MRVPLRRCKNRQLPVYCNIRKTAWQHVSSDVMRHHGGGCSALIRKRITLQNQNGRQRTRSAGTPHVARSARQSDGRKDFLSTRTEQVVFSSDVMASVRRKRLAHPVHGRAGALQSRRQGKKKQKTQNKTYGKRQREHERKETENH